MSVRPRRFLLSVVGNGSHLRHRGSSWIPLFDRLALTAVCQSTILDSSFMSLFLRKRNTAASILGLSSCCHSLLAILFTIVLIDSCSYMRRPKNKPRIDELTGTWECKELPVKFLSKLNLKQPVSSRLELSKDGSVTVTNLPDTVPNSLKTFTGTWEISPPNLTPSGSWMVRLNDGNYLQILTDGKSFVLSYILEENGVIGFVKK